MLKVIIGMDMNETDTLHMPPPKLTPMPVKFSSCNSEKTTACPSFSGFAL